MAEWGLLMGVQMEVGVRHDCSALNLHIQRPWESKAPMYPRAWGPVAWGPTSWRSSAACEDLPVPPSPMGTAPSCLPGIEGQALVHGVRSRALNPTPLFLSRAKL